MKAQEVILRFMHKNVSGRQAAEIIASTGLRRGAGIGGIASVATTDHWIAGL